PRARARAPGARAVSGPRASPGRGNGRRAVHPSRPGGRPRLERDGDLQGRRGECIAGGGRAAAMTKRVVVVTVAAMALAVSCLVASRSAAAFTARDMLGRDVALAAPPKRIISLVPSVTEILYALNAEHLLVGVTDFCDFPPEAKRQPKVGGMVAPSLE